MNGPDGLNGSSGGAVGASGGAGDKLLHSASAETSKAISSGVGKATVAAGGTTTTTTAGSAQKTTYSNLSMMKKKAGSSQPDQPSYVSEPMIEFLIAEILHYAESSCPPEDKSEEQAIFACEMSAAKLERIGYSVGYRLCERLAQNRTFGGAPAQAASKSQQGGAGAGTNNSAQALAAQQQQVKIDTANALAASQLEAVKFLCKEFWMEVFRKQIDKLQTNHRGVFVLKDLELSWLTRFPNNQEAARVTAIQLLAYPCGMLRGALANLGIPAVVSCDFLTDGQNMAACSFNVKIK